MDIFRLLKMIPLSEARLHPAGTRKPFGWSPRREADRTIGHRRIVESSHRFWTFTGWNYQRPQLGSTWREGFRFWRWQMTWKRPKTWPASHVADAILHSACLSQRPPNLPRGSILPHVYDGFSSIGSTWMAGQTITTSLGVAGRWLGFLNLWVTCLQLERWFQNIWTKQSVLLKYEQVTVMTVMSDELWPDFFSQLCKQIPKIWPSLDGLQQDHVPQIRQPPDLHSDQAGCDCGYSKNYVANHNSELIISLPFAKFGLWSRKCNFHRSHPLFFPASSVQRPKQEVLRCA